ncbi:MAG: YaiI/YqxD family protein [Myxococcota bacterium]
MTLTIWIDADAAPRDVKELVYRAAVRLKLPAVLVANRPLQPPHGVSWVTAVRVEGGPDVADRHIALHAKPGDLVVTQDIPLAALLVPKQIAVLDPRGAEHTAETIGPRLSVRDFMDQLRGTGEATGGPAPFDARAKHAFAAALDRVLTRLLAASRP